MAKLEPVETDDSVQQDAPPPPAAAPPQHEPPPPSPMVAPPQHQPSHLAAPPYQAQPEIQYADYLATVPGVSENLVIAKPWSTGLFDCHHDPRSGK